MRTPVRDYMLRAVRDLDALKAAGATVVDADRRRPPGTPTPHAKAPPPHQGSGAFANGRNHP